MRKWHCILGFLIFWGVSICAQPKPEELLEQAIINGVTLTFSFEDASDEDYETTVKQRRNPDGSVWRVTETIRAKDFNDRYWSFNSKTIYNSDGCFDLWVTQDGVMGIVTQDEIPRHTMPKDATYKMTSLTYQGRNCWKITERVTGGEMTEFIIDKEKLFILSWDYYNSSGMRLLSDRKKNINFNPVFTDDDFSVPPDAKLKYAKDSRERLKLYAKRAKAHSKNVIKTRKQITKATNRNTTPGKFRQKVNKLTNHNPLGFICQKAPWFLLPIAVIALGIVFWHKRKSVSH